jgi:hypothetical protein
MATARTRTLFPQRAQLLQPRAHVRGGQARRALEGRRERRRREAKAAARTPARGALHQRNAHARTLGARERRRLRRLARVVRRLTRLTRLGRLHRGGKEEGAQVHE